MALYWDPQEIFVRIGPRQESAEGRRAYHEEYTGSSLQTLQQSNNKQKVRSKRPTRYVVSRYITEQQKEVSMALRFRAKKGKRGEVADRQTAGCSCKMQQSIERAV